jgi:multidrug efflux pump subunit AcrB
MPGHDERRWDDDGALKDIAQNFVRNQLAGVPGASIPQPFGGPWRQIQFYVDPYKLEARQLSPMDVVRALNQSNLVSACWRRKDR